MPKPQTVLCYICGREFGSYSINVHERQCAKRWEKQRNKEKEAEKSERKRKISTSKDKLRDPWVRRDGPSLKANSKYSKSMNDIRLSNGGTHVTEIEREILHDARPSTVILKERDDVNGDLSAEETELNTKGDVSPEVPKLSRPGTAVLNKKYSSPILPSRVNPVLLMKAKEDENEEHAEKERNLEKDYNTLTEPSIVSLRKHSAPESISVRVSNSSPASSVSSHSSVDSQETPMRVTEGMPRFRSTKNPNLLVCYICGNEFGSKSLKIHEPQCLKKWKLANPRYYSRKGTHGGMFKADSTNAIHHKENFIKASNGGLPKSATKKGTFKSASCENLLDACSGTLKPTNSLQALKELSKSHNRLYTPSKKPTMEPCYICGKEIIKHSLAVHEKQCKKKWDALKEKNEKDDKKLSAASGLPSKRHSVNFPITIKVDKTEDVENNNLDKSKSQEQISEPEGEKKGSTSKVHKERKPSTVTCYICGRAYGTASISIHEKQCQKKWEAETARKEALLRPKSAKKKTKPRPSSFVL